MRKRVLRLAGLLVLLSVAGIAIAWWATALRPGVSRENLTRLRYLMTQQEVEFILGGPPDLKSGIARPTLAGPVAAGMRAEWKGPGSELCSLWFDKSGLLQQINYRSRPDAEEEIWNAPWNESLFDRLRHWFGL